MLSSYYSYLPVLNRGLYLKETIVKEVMNMNDMKSFRPTNVVIDLSAIRKNVENLKRHLTSNAEIIAVVKANAYGHGDLEVSKIALQAGATMLAVATSEEALHIRSTITEVPIIILGAVPVSFVPYAAQHNITLTVFSTEWIDAAAEQFTEMANPVKVHIKIDSGMGRLGVKVEHELLALYDAINRADVFELDGVFTHFATADEEDATYYEQQKNKFITMVEDLPVRPRLVHAANTAAALLKSDVAFDAVRFGISMYGLSPSQYVGNHLPYPLHPAMQLESEIVHIKQLQKGETVGYGATYAAQKDGEWIATLPIGYADGLLRGLEGQEVLVGGQRAKIVGRICMDQVMIRLANEMKVGDKVVLIGKQGNDEIMMQEWADKLQTIVYEIACMLSPRITRVYK